MSLFKRHRLTSLMLMCLAMAAATGCTEPAPEPEVAPPAAQTSVEIEQETAEQARIEAAAVKAEEDKQRRIQRNRNAVNDLMFLGMTVAEANEALGVNGEKGLSIGGDKEERQNYEWTLEGGITIKATFVNGKLDKKEMVE